MYFRRTVKGIGMMGGNCGEREFLVALRFVECVCGGPPPVVGCLPGETLRSDRIVGKHRWQSDVLQLSEFLTNIWPVRPG